MAETHEPISFERDCWIGKGQNHQNIKFDISTQHLKYNRTFMDGVMKPNYKRISIIRQPTSNFISSYRYYQHHMEELWRPFGLRNDTTKTPTQTLFDEMEHLLQSFDHANRIIQALPPSSQARLRTYRSELLYFGYFIDPMTGREWHSWDTDLTDQVMARWIEQIEREFDLILITEHYTLSLAVMCVELGWAIEDAIYMRVNSQVKTDLQLSANAVNG